MIKRMEFRFTVVAISVISTVLLALLVGVNAITIHNNVRKVDNLLKSIVTEEKADHQSNFRTDDYNELDRENLLEGDEKDKHTFRREENRLFDVFIDKDLELISTNADIKNIVEEGVAYALALEAIEEQSEHGFISEYRYLVINQDEYTWVVFLDYSFERGSELNFIWASIGFFVLAVILVAILVRIFLKPVMKPIQEAYTKQKQFITDASHELKTPLTIISTDMQLIEMENGSTNWTKSINNQVERLKVLSNDLVTLSRMEEQDMQIEMARVNLSDLVNDVVMGFEPAIEASGKAFNCSIEEDIIIKGNYDALERVMSVLMNNALKYCSRNGTVRVNLKQKGKNIKLKVENTTNKVEKGNHDEYFERFYRGDKSRNSKTGGFGIGLAIAKSTIEEHKGKIEAKSPDGNSLVIAIGLNAV